MMIFGIGTDIVSYDRIFSLYRRFGNCFVHKILSKSELDIFCNKTTESGKINYLARRFSAKESVLKAIGTGFGKNCGFLDVVITNSESGLPLVNLNTSVTKRIFHEAKPNIMVSISDEKNQFAISYAIITIDQNY